MNLCHIMPYDVMSYHAMLCQFMYYHVYVHVGLYVCMCLWIYVYVCMHVCMYRRYACIGGNCVLVVRPCTCERVCVCT